MDFTQLIVLVLIVYGMIWVSKSPLERGLPAGIVIGLLFAFSNDGNTKSTGIAMIIFGGIAWLFYKFTTK
jgi:hypothetical protein